MFYFFNWELISPIDNLTDVTQGNEIIEIYIDDIDGCRPTSRYMIPIVQSGQSFALLPINLLYQSDKCSNTLKDISVKIRIVRGKEHRLIYQNDFVLLAPYYTNGTVVRIPIYRVWYCEDYYKMYFANALAFLQRTQPLSYL